MATYTPPAFLEDQDVDAIHQEMLDQLPDDIDKSEGGFAWDFTRPTALEKAQFSQFQLSEAVKQIFPQFASGEFLDYHAENRGITRKAATAATGTVTVTGTAGTTIPLGSEFSTSAANGESSVSFATTEATSIGVGGTVDITVRATTTGTIGNVSIGSITRKASNLTGVSSVTNAAATSGGTEEEDDEDLRKRITEYDQTQGVSFVGSNSDYKRWAETVDGTGTAVVVPASDNTGLVTIIVTDPLGNPASHDVLTAVYNYIMRPDDANSRLAPINASLSVVAPTTTTITVAATIQLASGYTIETATASLVLALKSYFTTAVGELVVRYSEIAKRIIELPEIVDYEDLTINGGTSNITLQQNELPTVTASDITLTEGTI